MQRAIFFPEAFNLQMSYIQSFSCKVLGLQNDKVFYLTQFAYSTAMFYCTNQTFVVTNKV